jgi:hypothetical protein
VTEVIGEAHAPFRRTAWIVAGCLTITIVVMLVGPFEQFSAADLERVRLVESSLVAACQGHGGHIDSSVEVLLGYLRRNPYQPLPLHGGTKADSMLEELQALVPQLTGSRCASARETLVEATTSAGERR